jgi:hypothetical protein
MTLELSADVRKRLDAHLDAVEQALSASGRSREQRRGIVDDLEAQILDMLAGKSATPALGDLDAVLAKLDPPAAYGEGAGRPNAPLPRVPTVPARPRYARTAIWGLVCILLSLLPVPVLAVGAFFVFSQHTTSPAFSGRAQVQNQSTVSPERAMAEPPAFAPRENSVPFWRIFGNFGLCMFALVGPLALAGTVLGWIAFGQIRGSGGMLRGTGLALFDGLFYPAAILLMGGLTFA